MIEVKFSGNIISKNQLKCVNTNCSSLYGKVYLNASDYTTQEIDFSDNNYNINWLQSLAIISNNKLEYVGNRQGYDAWINNIVDKDNDPLYPFSTKDLQEFDYWAGTYSGVIADKIFNMKTQADEIPAGLWITDYNKLTITASYLEYNENQNFVYLFGDDRYGFNTNFNLPLQNLYDFSDATITGAKAETDMSFRILKSLENVYLRLKNFGNNSSINGGIKSVSKIISEIDLINDAEGLILYEPSERVYLELNNQQEILINNIDIDIVDIKERVINYLEDGTVIILHIEN